ncbi:AIPR family protein [Synergistaceae bacterium OttesenSCG-928-D05]|nr:AIPR family protein [Synergistaceae bacterium OttesenSCG-928-D05]
MSIYEKICEEIKGDYYIQNYQNEGQRFVAWYVLNILRQDKNQTKDAITDGANDKQIDAIVIDDDKQTVYILQGKFLSGSLVDAEPLREVLSSWVQLKDLVNLQTVGNSKLQSKLSEVAQAFEDEYEVCFELITTSKLTDAATADLETFQRKLAEMSEGEDFDAVLSLVDAEELEHRYELAMVADNPQINYTLDLTGSQCMPINLAGTEIVIAAVPLKEAIKIRGIKDGSLFQKNVRQSLGNSNPVNKRIRDTINNGKHRDFFFFHNGITAICNKMELEGNSLRLTGLNVVNGCQSLTNILSCSETVKKQDDSFVLFRFYEIPQRDRADMISINTNSQSAVKPRDLRSNDRRVLTLKKQFEQKFEQGYFITKRGEQAPASKDKNYVIDLSDFGKYLIAWYSQRPNISYGETKIFDKYFEILFKKGQNYKPEDIQALNSWMREVRKVWVEENPLGFDETLLVMKAYAPFHHMYAVSMIFSVANNQSGVPSPQATWEAAQKNGKTNQLIKMAGRCLSSALKNALNRASNDGKIFNPANWIKSNQCLNDINATIPPTLDAYEAVDKDVYDDLIASLKIDPAGFTYRLQAG